jgi:hypothetical protein
MQWDEPEAYQALTDPEKAALLEWIRLAVKPAKTRLPGRTSYGIKHDFERDAFYVTNGEFKGALLAAGLEPAATAGRSNWPFKIRPACPNRLTPGAHVPVRLGGGNRFGLWHLPPEERAEFERLVRTAIGGK